MSLYISVKYRYVVLSERWLRHATLGKKRLGGSPSTKTNSQVFIFFAFLLQKTTWSKWDQNELYRIKDRNVFNWWSNVPSWMHVQTKDNNAKGKAREATNRPAGQLKAECDFWLLSKDPWSPPGFFHESCMLMYDQHICISVSMNLYYYPTYMCNPIFKIDTINCAARIAQGQTLLQLGSKHIMNP